MKDLTEFKIAVEDAFLALGEADSRLLYEVFDDFFSRYPDTVPAWTQESNGVNVDIEFTEEFIDSPGFDEFTARFDEVSDTITRIFPGPMTLSFDYAKFKSLAPQLKGSS